MLPTSDIDHNHSTSCVIAHHLDIGYQGEVVVPEVNFELTCGESLALVGINGSGKTTLLKSLNRLTDMIFGALHTGQIFIDGRHVGGCDELYALDRAGKLVPLLAAS